MDSTVIHINSGKAYGRQGKAPKGLNFQHSTLLHAISAYLSDSNWQHNQQSAEANHILVSPSVTWCPYICINIRVNLFEPRFKLVGNEKRFDEKADFSTLPFSLDIFNSMSKSCIDTHAPLCRTKIARPPAPWLNTDDIEQLQNERNELSYLT